MNKSNKICLADFFSVVENIPYVIVRGTPDSLLDYIPGSDIDVFCYDKNKFGRAVLYFANTYIEKGFEIKVTDSTYGDHTQIDFLLSGKIELRFDLYGQFPQYKKINIKTSLLNSVIENAICLVINGMNSTVNIFIPNPIDDILLRYIEYIEYYEERPDKIKHLDYINSQIENLPDNRIKFLDKLHRYTDLPKCTDCTSHHAKDEKEKKSHQFLTRLSNKLKSIILMGIY